MPPPHVAPRRHRRHGQPAGAQERRGAPDHRGGRRRTALPAALLARSQPDRAGHLKTQSPSAQSPGAFDRHPLAAYRQTPRSLPTRRMCKLLRKLRLRSNLSGFRSRCGWIYLAAGDDDSGSPARFRADLAYHAYPRWGQGGIYQRRLAVSLFARQVNPRFDNTLDGRPRSLGGGNGVLVFAQGTDCDQRPHVFSWSGFHVVGNQGCSSDGSSVRQHLASKFSGLLHRLDPYSSGEPLRAQSAESASLLELCQFADIPNGRGAHPGGCVFEWWNTVALCCTMHSRAWPDGFCRNHLCGIFPRRDEPGSGLWLQHRRFGVGRLGRVIFDATGVPALTIVSDGLLSALSLVAAAAAGERLIVASLRTSTPLVRGRSDHFFAGRVNNPDYPRMSRCSAWRGGNAAAIEQPFERPDCEVSQGRISNRLTLGHLKNG